jgi:hypothetical protein
VFVSAPLQDAEPLRFNKPYIRNVYKTELGVKNEKNTYYLVAASHAFCSKC